MNEEMTFEYEGLQVYRKYSIYDYEGNKGYYKALDRRMKEIERVESDVWDNKEWIEYCNREEAEISEIEGI